MHKVVLITGVSSGFGLSTARLLAKHGHTVYGTVRDLSEIFPSVNILKMDLTDVISIKDAVDSVIAREGKIDVLINNAGMHTGGPFETTSVETMNLQLETNVLGTIHVIREVLPHMRKRKSGTIINISSIGGIMGLPFQSYYSASKFAMEGYSSALRMEVRQFGIKIVLVNPGDFSTNNTKNRRNFIHCPEDDPYSIQFSKTLNIIEKDERGGWPADKLAKKLLKIVESYSPSNRYVVANFSQRFAVILHKFLPSKWFYAILSLHYKIS